VGSMRLLLVGLVLGVGITSWAFLLGRVFGHTVEAAWFSVAVGALAVWGVFGWFGG
jgi:hypothetical protein